MAALDAGYDVRASGVTLDRFCGSGITANNFAAAMVMAGHGGPRHRRRHRDDVAAEEGPPADGRRQRAPPGAPPAVAPGRVRRRHRVARGHRPRARSTRTPPSRSAAPRSPSRKAASTGASIPVLNLDGTRRPRPRGVPASAARPPSRSPRWRRASPPSPTTASPRACPTFRELINQRYPDLEIKHVHHAGNSSGVVDGAAAVLYASEDYVKAHGLKPRARVVASAQHGRRPDADAQRARCRRPARSSSGPA